MTPFKLIFMGTPEFALPTLRHLVETGQNIVAVYTQPPRPAGRGQKDRPSVVHQYALEKNIPVFTPVTLKDEKTQAEFKAHNADAAIVAAYGLLLPKPILDGTKMGCINVHPSLLPRWRGAAPIQRTVMAGDEQTGVTIMQMNEGLDTGDMLVGELYDVSPYMNAGELHNILAEMAGPLVIQALEGLRDNTIVPIPQPESGVTYAKKITKDECRIDWNESAESIHHKILGLSPSPGAFFIHTGEAIKILDAETYEPNPEYKKFKPGTVVDEYLTVACAEGALCHLRVQRPGKKPMMADEMLKGYPIPPGTVFE